MKKRLYRAAGFILAFVMILTTVVPALANESGASTGKVRRETLELEHGTMYFEETSDYAILYTVYDEGNISYAIRYNETPSLIHSGLVSAEQRRGMSAGTAALSSADTFALVGELLQLKPMEVVDFSKREASGASTRDLPAATTPAEALAYARDNISGYSVPMNYALIGTYYGTKTVQIYQTVGAYVSNLGLLHYYIDDIIDAVLLAYITSGVSLAGLISVIPTVFKVGKGYLAIKNGSVYLFKIENPRTRMACIDGVRYYWAGWDRNFHLYFGTDGSNWEI
ncbi:MAG: hypothetical protein IKV99_06860, partial [Oscillospiraceae bacterium]|nr:hypothetical protein [Oscillospiraceae bacterium]